MLLAISTFQQVMSPVIATIQILTISFTISRRSLKNHQPCHRSNSHINSTNTQHLLHDLMMTSSEPAFNKTRWGDIPKLPHNNYNEWKDDIILILSAMRAYPIVTRDNPEPQPLDFNRDDNYDDWTAKEAEAAAMIRLSCSPEVRGIVKGIRNPHGTWNTLETSLDTDGSYIGRQDILRQFRACRPKEDQPLKAYFTKLSNYRIQLDHIDDAVTDRDFRMEIVTSLPSQYVMILMVLKPSRPLPTPEEAMHDLLEEESTASLTKELGDASTGAALFSHCGGYCGRGHQRGGRGGCGGRGGRGRRGGSGGHRGHSGHG